MGVPILTSKIYYGNMALFLTQVTLEVWHMYLGLLLQICPITIFIIMKSAIIWAPGIIAL